jgi:hypothetical protein
VLPRQVGSRYELLDADMDLLWCGLARRPEVDVAN